MKKLFLITLSVAIFFCSCKSKVASAPATSTENKAASFTDYYFDFTADGKEFQIAADDVSATLSNVNGHPAFKIFAGADDKTGIMLTIPKNMKSPSSTPSGSANLDESISQGSVSLLNYPQKNYTTNSFNTVYPEMSKPVADAVVITSIEADGKDAKIITGTFNVKTFGTHSNNNTDAKDTDHTVKGKFRIRHEFHSYNGDRF